jgi:hypothetical protein
LGVQGVVNYGASIDTPHHSSSSLPGSAIGQGLGIALGSDFTVDTLMESDDDFDNDPTLREAILFGRG